LLNGKKRVTKKFVSTGLISVILLILIYTDPLWTRYPGGLWIPLIFLLIVAGFFWLIIKLVEEVIGLIKNRKAFKMGHLLQTILIVGILCFSFFNTFSFDIEDKIYGKVVFRACYEGTQNHTTFKLREGNRFEVHATGVFFYDEYFTGQYIQRGDTVDLEYNGRVNKAIGEKVFLNNRDEVLEPTHNNLDSTRRPLKFYYGYCKGLN
jgi:hypothetical protein